MNKFLTEKWFSRQAGMLLAIFGFVLGHLSDHWFPVLGFVLAVPLVYLIEKPA